MAVDIEKATDELIEVLHKNKIPVGLTQAVFDKAAQKIADRTIPYSPIKEERP